jgi:archaellum component FlaD/FlaE
MMPTSLALRREHLLHALPTSIDLLRRRRCSEIPNGYIDDYVALNWLEWHGGGLRVTTVGENICRHVVDRHLPLPAETGKSPSA